MTYMERDLTDNHIVCSTGWPPTFALLQASDPRPQHSCTTSWLPSQNVCLQ